MLFRSLWPKSLEHDRFIVTDVGGINLGEGFDEKAADGTDEVLFTLLGRDIHKSLICKFSGEPTYVAKIKKGQCNPSS